MKKNRWTAVVIGVVTGLIDRLIDRWYSVDQERQQHVEDQTEILKKQREIANEPSVDNPLKAMHEFDKPSEDQSR